MEDETNDNSNSNNINNINHIVLSGGAYLGLYELGTLNYLQRNKFYDYNKIKTIHGTSVGGLIGAIMCIEENMKVVCDYFIERPWSKLIQITPTMFFDVIPKKGLIGREIFQYTLEPILKNNDLTINTTLQELYEKTGKELYLYSVSMSSFKEVIISHKTHPELDIITAVHMTCALPYLVQPVWYENDYFIDGGLINNFPIHKCMELDNMVKDSILSISFDTEEINKTIDESINIFEYGYILYKKLAKNLKYKNYCRELLKNHIIIPCKEMNLSDGYNAFNNTSVRKDMIQQGENYAKIFLIYNNKDNNKDNKKIDSVI